MSAKRKMSAPNTSGRPFGYPVTRCIELGGTSNQWHGICAPLDALDFEPRPWIEHSGWPIRRAHLAPFYDEAAAMLGVRAPEALEPGGVDAAFRRSLDDLAFDRSVLDTKLFQAPKPPTRWKGTLVGWRRKENFAA